MGGENTLCACKPFKIGRIMGKKMDGMKKMKREGILLGGLAVSEVLRISVQKALDSEGGTVKFIQILCWLPSFLDGWVVIRHNQAIGASGEIVEEANLSIGKKSLPLSFKPSIWVFFRWGGQVKRKRSNHPFSEIKSEGVERDIIEHGN